MYRFLPPARHHQPALDLGPSVEDMEAHPSQADWLEGNAPDSGPFMLPRSCPRAMDSRVQMTRHLLRAINVGVGEEYFPLMNAMLAKLPLHCSVSMVAPLLPG
jgi:hypothetical protein